MYGKRLPCGVAAILILASRLSKQSIHPVVNQLRADLSFLRSAQECSRGAPAPRPSCRRRVAGATKTGVNAGALAPYELLNAREPLVTRMKLVVYQLPIVACDNATAIFEDMDFDLVASPVEAVFQGWIEDMHPLVAGGDEGVGIMHG